jgi:hypothetical protein
MADLRHQLIAGGTGAVLDSSSTRMLLVRQARPGRWYEKCCQVIHLTMDGGR